MAVLLIHTSTVAECVPTSHPPLSLSLLTPSPLPPHTLPSPSSHPPLSLLTPSPLPPPPSPLPTTFHTAQSSSANSRTAFKWLQGYEKCRSGWDRFTKPGHSHNGENSSQLINFGSESESAKPVGLAFPETWPWSHIITPNSDGTTVIARKELNSCKT